ncbi:MULTISPECIES: hypothetical protein [Clostridium]|uniref:hypothetical protein n=1 Tax=Clostridium TaxID=1485 RepID=UPI0008265ADB|nr:MULTISPECIES: hypothetical protein [Clostridium]PJI10549.1 hypothetical protein CUB90_00710 [Clostridium sp. CT7]
MEKNRTATTTTTEDIYELSDLILGGDIKNTDGVAIQQHWTYKGQDFFLNLSKPNSESISNVIKKAKATNTPIRLTLSNANIIESVEEIRYPKYQN